MPSPDPAERRLRAIVAANTRVSREPSTTAMTERARSAFRQSFYDATDAALAPAVRERQADAAYRAHMANLARKGMAKRRAAAQSRAAAQAAEAAAQAAEAELDTMTNEAADAADQV